jgi:hypothetical protein
MVDTYVVLCSHDGCSNGTKVNRWAKIRAQDEGWYFQRNGSLWCPEHRPSFAPAWPPS